MPVAESLRVGRGKRMGDREVAIHRVISDWGEGTSIANGMGAPATPGDATWIHTFFDAALWQQPGGDFAPVPTATALVGGNGPVSWDVGVDAQRMLDDPATNFGWILLSDESQMISAKRFRNRESTEEEETPRLQITYATATPLELCQGLDGVETLRVNEDNGVGTSNTVLVDASARITFTIDPPLGGGSGRFLATLEAGSPTPATLDVLPPRFGIACFPLVLSRGASPLARWNALGRPDRLGTSVFFGVPLPEPDRAPSTFFDAPGGDPNLSPGMTFTLQAAIRNPLAANPRDLSLTNAVRVEIR